MMLTPEAVVGLLETRPNFRSGTPNGACHFFVKLNDNWGVKFMYPLTKFRWDGTPIDKDDFDKYLAERRERIARERQRQITAHEAGLAPAVGELVEMETPDGLLFGYITECVQTFGYDDKEEMKIYKGNRDALELELCIIGIDTDDMKPANCGLIDGSLVFIDFGDEGME